MYEIQYQSRILKQWKNVCQRDSSNKEIAHLIDSAFVENVASDRIAVACTSGALGKCIDWGYPPWKSYNGVPLKRYHQACVRMVRADYLGDGNSFTREGVPIAFTDALGIRKLDVSVEMRFEATWDEHGVRRLVRPRFRDLLPVGRPSTFTRQGAANDSGSLLFSYSEER